MFQIHPLGHNQFSHLYGLDDEALAAHGAKGYVADTKPGFPCRVSLRDAEIGERVILLNFEHEPSQSQYRASHAIFIRDGARVEMPAAGDIPDVLKARLLSVRVFDKSDMMIEADVCDGQIVGDKITEFFDNPAATYIHLHNAKPGCFAAKVTRA